MLRGKKEKFKKHNEKSEIHVTYNVSPKKKFVIYYQTTLYDFFS